MLFLYSHLIAGSFTFSIVFFMLVDYFTAELLLLASSCGMRFSGFFFHVSNVVISLKLWKFARSDLNRMLDKIE